MEAPVLKTKQTQHQKIKVALKSVLCTPFIVQWPKINAEINKDIICLLTNILTIHNLRKPKVNGKLKKNARKALMKDLLNEKSDIERNLRSQLLFGINEVTKSLEKDQLRLVLADRSAHTLTKHLMQLSVVRNCLAVSLNEFAKAVAPLLGLTQLSCLGFRKLQEGDHDLFRELIEFVDKNVPKMELPWLQFENSLAEGLESDTENSQSESDSDVPQFDNNEKTEKIISSQNYADVSDTSEKEMPKNKQSLGLNDVHVTCTKDLECGFGNKDFIAFNDNDLRDTDGEKLKYLECQSPEKVKRLRPKKRKLKAVNKKDSVSKPESKYQKMSLHKMQRNTNRKSKNRKIKNK